MAAPSIRRVLCAVDVTRPALGALRRGVEIARRFDATCDVVYARDASQLRLASLLPSTDELVSRFEAEERLDTLLRAEGVESASGRSIDGRPSSTLLARCGSTSADLIVLGWNLREAPPAFARPSVGRWVASRATCAVLTVREEPASAGIRSILVPVDFSSGTASALAWSAAFARRFEAQVHLVHVSRRPRFGSEARTAPAARALLEAVIRLRDAGITATSEILCSKSNTSQAILERCADDAFDLLIMGAHRALPHESEGEGVLAEVRGGAGLPVLSVRPGGARLEFMTRSGLENSSKGGDCHVGTA